MRRLLVLALLISATSLSAQTAVATVAPGMTRAKVIAILGTPATDRSAAEFTYLFYNNSCGKRCGMNDLVILRGDSVVDAIFRSPNRHYSGTSSSPAPISSKSAARPHSTSPATSTPAARPAASPSPRMKPPAEANDTRPSIPSNPPTVRLAPPATTSPKTRTP
jgi:hypothetical protein